MRDDDLAPHLATGGKRDVSFAEPEISLDVD